MPMLSLGLMMLAGAIGGLVAGWVMERFQAVAAPAFGLGGGDAEPATVKAGDRLSKAATGAPVPRPRRMLVGDAVHYLTALVLGLGYGALVFFWPVAAVGFGAAYGLAIALVLDDLVVPALGLGSWPWRTGAGTHAYGLASHIVFGAVLEAVRRLALALVS